VKKDELKKRLPPDYCVLGILTVSDNLSLCQLKPHFEPLLQAHQYRDECTLLSTLMTQLEQEQRFNGGQVIYASLK
jgi:hypothetical protein